MTRILITFGDNDFHVVMRAFGDLFLAGQEWEESALTKPNIVRWFNAVAPTLYEMVQASGRSGYSYTPGGYLTINESRVYIGPEVDAKMVTWAEWGNGDAVLIDFRPFPKPTVTIV